MQMATNKMDTADHPGVPIHPPLFFLSALLLGALIDDRVRRLVISITINGDGLGY